jgi:hypothetical protein
MSTEVNFVATAMGPSVPPDFSRVWEVTPTVHQEAVKSIMDGFLKSPSGGFFRAATAMAKFNVPWNPDEYSGHVVERNWLLDMYKESANNVFVLSGDLHDTWFWTLYKDVRTLHLHILLFGNVVLIMWVVLGSTNR